MRIPIPNWLTSTWDIFCDWADVPVYRRIRRIDVLLVIIGILVVSYYAIYGWRSAVLGGALYILFVMIGLWLL